MNELTTAKLQGVLPMTHRKAQFVRTAFYKTHTCKRSINSIIVLQNSDGSLSVRNPLDGAVYNVVETGDGYEFDIVGFDDFGGGSL